MTKATRGRISGLALFLACLTTNAYAAQQAGPTMDETRAWLASEGRDLMHVAASHLDTARNIKVQRRDSVDRIALDNCVLTWTMIRQTTISVGGQPSEDRTYTIDVTIAMKDLIASGLTVEPDTLFADEPAYQVRVPVRQTLEAEATSSISMDHDNPVSIAFATLPVGTAEDGRRIATAIRHAAGLCKVPSGPF